MYCIRPDPLRTSKRVWLRETRSRQPLHWHSTPPGICTSRSERVHCCGQQHVQGSLGSSGQENSQFPPAKPTNLRYTST